MFCVIFTFRLYYLLVAFIVLCLLVVISLVVLRKLIRNKKQNAQKTGKQSKNQCQVGVFHPYCNAGGGGERVLWCAIQAIQNE